MIGAGVGVPLGVGVSLGLGEGVLLAGNVEGLLGVTEAVSLGNFSGAWAGVSGRGVCAAANGERLAVGSAAVLHPAARQASSSTQSQDLSINDE